MKSPNTLMITLLLFCITSQAQTTQDLINAAQQFPAMPRETADMIPFVNGLPTFGSGTPFNDLEYTIMDFDYIDGENGGGDVFMPVDPSRPSPGSNRVKYIRSVLNTDLNENYSTADRDRIILGTAEIVVPFFSRGADGLDNDYAVIQHFDYNFGNIQLRGQESDYDLLYATQADGVATEGYYLFYTADFASTNQVDLIAFIYPCDDLQPPVSGNPPQNQTALCNNSQILDLDNSIHFSFAKPIDPNISFPYGVVQYGGSGKDVIGGLTADDNGNIYLMGSTDSDLSSIGNNGNEIFISKIDPNGNTLWINELPLPDGSLLFDAVTDANFVYVCGRTLGAIPSASNAGRWDGIILKIDINTGELVASNQWGNPGIDGYGNIVLDNQGGLYVSGQGSPAGQSGTDDSYLVAKHNTNDLSNSWRVIQPTVATGFSASAEAWGGLYFKAGSTPEQDRLIVAGWYIAQGGANCFISIYDNLYAPQPSRPHSIVFDSPGAEADWVMDNVVDSQGNIYVAGFTSGNLGGPHQGEGDAYVRKYSPTLTNPQTFQFGTPKSDMVRKMEIDNEDNLYLAGYTYGNLFGNNADESGKTGDIFALKLDSDFNILASGQFGTPHEERTYAALSNDFLYLGGMTEGNMTGQNLGSFDAYALALSAEDLSVPTLGISEEVLNIIKLYPNPAQQFVKLSGAEGLLDYTIFDLNGNKLQLGPYQEKIRIDHLQAGLYLIQIQSLKQKETLKLIKL
ncbi:SBBP repeat-containing protein [Psychroflexus tropicus]|uniref:SBBP repeat-containing protein n=1 Tax=Psychroflexus tropicus TaxID=197345 RepID=UPI0003818BE3|nr:SBBP repeat-containing protein [Psychroflexus tropicus]